MPSTHVKMSTAGRRRPRHSYTYSLCVLAALTASTVDAAVCSDAQQTQATTIITANKATFQACLSDLKTSTTTSSTDVWTSFITEDAVSRAATADVICASDNCVKALIVAMEQFPDCCSTSPSVRNIPRLADDILHQCDIRDARLLASELETEISKLPDLKVQIKSLGNANTGSSSSNGNHDVGDDGVDVIIDVKKRELMKSGVGLATNETESKSTGAANSGLSQSRQTTVAMALVIVAATAIQLLV